MSRLALLSASKAKYYLILVPFSPLLVAVTVIARRILNSFRGLTVFLSDLMTQSVEPEGSMGLGGSLVGWLQHFQKPTQTRSRPLK